MKLGYWLLTALVLVVLIAFAVSNRGDVAVSFWPFFGGWQSPLYAIVLLSGLAGFLLGELVAWINGRRARRLARQRARRIEALERELAATQARLPDAATPAAAPPVARLPQH